MPGRVRWNVSSVYEEFNGTFNYITMAEFWCAPAGNSERFGQGDPCKSDELLVNRAGSILHFSFAFVWSVIK